MIVAGVFGTKYPGAIRLSCLFHGYKFKELYSEKVRPSRNLDNHVDIRKIVSYLKKGLQLKPCYKAFKTLLSKSAVKTLLESLLNLAMVKNAKTCRITAKPCIFKK
jgi:hypothetical protein